MRGSIRKRCQCRDEEGRRVTGCRKAHGSWSFTIDAGTSSDSGKRKQVARSGFRTRDEAEDAMTKELAALNAGTWTDDQGITAAAWLAQWLDELAERGRSPKTLASYRTHVRDVWAPQLGHMRLRDLRRGHVERVLADLGKPAEGSRRVGNSGSFVERRSPATLDSYRRTLRAALAVAVRRGLVTLNPATGRMDAIPDRHHDDELVVWEPQQTARFLEHVADDRLSALYEVATYAGLRRGEVCGLRWADLTDDGTGILIRQTVVELTRSQARVGRPALRHLRRGPRRPSAEGTEVPGRSSMGAHCPTRTRRAQGSSPPPAR